MTDRIVLASRSEIRRTLLRNAAIRFEVAEARVDEHAIRDVLLAEGAAPRDIADTLAEQKARKVGLKHPQALVIGSDQIAAFAGKVLAKPRDPEDAVQQLRAMSGATHQLLSAAVIYHETKPVWRHVGVVRMHMRHVSDTYLEDYVPRNWQASATLSGPISLKKRAFACFIVSRGIISMFWVCR